MPKNLLGGGNDDQIGITAPPLSLSITRSASVFTQVTVNNYGLLCPAPGTYDGTNVFYRPHRDAGNAIANLEYLPGRAGICPLPASGSWWVNCQTNIAAGVSRMVLYDMPSLQAMLALMQSLQTSNPFNRIYGTGTHADITNVDSAIVAANTARNAVILTHSGTSDGATASTADVWLNFGGAAAVKGDGILIASKQSLIFDTTSGITLQAIRGIAASGTVRIGVQEAT